MHPTQSIANRKTQSLALYERARRVMPGGNSRLTTFDRPFPTYAHRGEGCWIIDVEGVKRLDLLNNYTSLLHGHADPDVVSRVQEVLKTGSAFSMPTSLEIALAETLTQRVPSVEQIRFTNSGTEAVMMALKAARAFTGRSGIAKFEGCYHGTYDYAEISQDPRPESWTIPPRPVALSRGTPRGVLQDLHILRFNVLEGALETVRAEGDRLAAVLLDLSPARLGMIPADIDFVNGLREVTREQGVLLIIDEVISFRVAHGGLQEDYGVRPDLTTFGKVIGGGFPIGAVGGRSDVMAVFDPSSGEPAVPHSGTFNANPISMAAGLATLEKYRPDEISSFNELGTELRAGIAGTFRDAGVPAQITGRGSLFAVHLHHRELIDFRSSAATDEERELAESIRRELSNDGVHIAPGLFGCLSTAMGKREVQLAVDAFARAIDRVAAEA